MKRRLTIPAIGVLLTIFAASAGAQTAFVGAGVGGALARFNHQSSESPSISDNDISGNTFAWSLTAGATVARHAVLQMEFGRTAPFESKTGPIVLLIPCPTCSTTTTTTRYESSRLGVLAGYATDPTRRVTVSALAGVVFVGQSVRSESITQLPPLTPVITPILPVRSKSTVYLVGPEFGLDAAIALTRHLRVVPQARLYRLGAFTSFVGSHQALITLVSAEGRWYF